jgi:hypothetical protein
MFGLSRRRSDADTVIEERPLDVSGGVSIGAILTGVVVALGALFVISAIIGGVLVGADIQADDLGEGVEIGVSVGVVMIGAQFLAYMWGGYTAGRMARGAGAANGILVPVLALILLLLVGAVATALGATAELGPPFTATRLPVEDDLVLDWGVGIAIGSLLAMLLGGLAGGLTGVRWHSRLERTVLEERAERRPAASPREIRLEDKEPVVGDPTSEARASHDEEAVDRDRMRTPPYR